MKAALRPNQNLDPNHRWMIEDLRGEYQFCWLKSFIIVDLAQSKNDDVVRDRAAQLLRTDLVLAGLLFLLNRKSKKIHKIFTKKINSAPKSAISFKIPPVPLNRETNKGAQLMAKMGWEGKGLGVKEQVN